MVENLLNIDHLIATGCQPKWFGLGFIQLKLDPKNRMHFWHPELRPDDPAFENEFHDHRYDFSSRVLVGEITNHLAIAEGTPERTDWKMFEVCCAGGGQQYLHPVYLTNSGVFATQAGQEYFLHRDTFHRVEVSRCVTIQSRSDDLKEKARVIQHKDHPSANPFESQIETAKVWEYIRDLLPERPGYHLRGIEKGVLGEPSKIREEAEELIDAYEQDARVMELVEVSDLIGAVEAFLENRHPGYTLDDLKTFSDITKRAFQNGRRS
jgi:hypothetical protein